MLCNIPLGGKQKYLVTNVGVKSKVKLSCLIHQHIEFEMNENQHKTPERNLKIVLTNSNCKLFLNIQ